MRDVHRTPNAEALPGRVTVRELESAVGRLVGVEGVRIVVGTRRPVEAIHVVMGPAWRADTVRRDVQALLLQHFDLRIDADAIHVSHQPQEVAAPAATPNHRDRVVLEAVHLALRGAGSTVEVHLRLGDQDLRGSAEADSPAAVLAAVADATVAALAPVATTPLDVVVADLAAIGNDKLAITTVIATDGRAEQRLAGTALVRNRAEDAMARAVLDATNRLHGI